MKRNRVPMLVLDPGRESLVSSSGGLLLRRTIELSGLARSLSTAMSPWASSRAVHDPGKVLLDVATAVALGGDCLADLAVVRAQPEVFGPVASDPTVSRLVATLAGDVDAALTAIRAARAEARARVWGRRRPVAGQPGGQVTIDLDATLVTAHSEKELASPTFKRGFGFHPLFAFVDHGEEGSGETVAGMLRTGSAGANCASDHITVLDGALAQLPEAERGNVVVRTDTGGGVKDFLHHITDLGLEYSVGFYGMPPIVEALAKVPRQAWRAAIDSDGLPREGAQVAELTRYLPATLRGWPEGMRVIARRERPHPGAQLRLTDHEGWRITCFATNTRGPGWTLAALEVWHRQRARAEDRIRGLKDTGLRNLPFHRFAHSQIWLAMPALRSASNVVLSNSRRSRRKIEAKGYRFVVVSSDAFSPAKLRTMTALGAELTIEPSLGGHVTPDLVPRMVARATELAAQPDTYFTDQLRNSDFLVGYREIGRELVEQMDRPIDVFCAAVGTAGLSMGVSGALQDTGSKVRVVIFEPGSSAPISGGRPGTHHVEGIGIGFVPPLLDPGRYDDVRPVAEADGRMMARRLAAEEGLLTGTSSGLNVAGAIAIAEELGAGHTVVTVAVHTGLKYLDGDLFVGESGWSDLTLAGPGHSVRSGQAPSTDAP